MSNDRWDPALYDQKHSFVFEYGRSLVSLLNPQAGERVLDLGCGPGQLTRAISESGADVTGVDNSAKMIATARAHYPELQFEHADARSFSFPYSFDAIFSNAALHWILDAESVVRSISRSLRSGGRFVAEFGGERNIGSIEDALRETLRMYGRDDEGPWWYYPTIGEYATLLEQHGLAVTFATLQDRLTKLEDGEDGLRNWIEMFKGESFSDIAPNTKDKILTSVENKL